MKGNGKLIVLSHQQEQNIIHLSQAIPKLVCEIGLINTHIHQKAIDIAINFRQFFEKYAKCHQKLNPKNVFDGNEIVEFSKFACFTVIVVLFHCICWHMASLGFIGPLF